MYNSLPMFQQIGSRAYKEGLENTSALDGYLHHPHRNYKTIHVAGTNGKGSCSHTLAAILQDAGYRTGLYTSPHLIDFRERIRVNGECIPEAYITTFVEKHRPFFEPLYPSFFELTTAMALNYFADAGVDVAVIEVGLGGRLDCTNIISPDLSIITNISHDHTAQLGHTPAAIAREKAGIIKPAIPVVIGEATEETRPVFLNRAKEVGAPIVFAEDEKRLLRTDTDEEGFLIYQTNRYKDLKGELRGIYQVKNTNTLLSAIAQLEKAGYLLPEKSIRAGFGNVCELTGLMGRWQKLRDHPALICDTGHNTAGMADIVKQLQMRNDSRLRLVIGMVDDKDTDGILSLLPREATCYFTKPTVKRALPEQTLRESALRHGLRGEAYPGVIDAVKAALAESQPTDLVFVGGSSFVVADLLAGREALDFD